MRIDPNSLALLGQVSELEAPAGTTTVRVQAVYRQRAGYDGGSMYFDDLSLVEVVVVPLEADWRMGSLLDWSAASPSSTYQLQESDDGSNWTHLGEVFVGDTASSFFVVEEAPFYQVVETTSGSAGNGVPNPGFETAEAQIHPSIGATQWRVSGAQDSDPLNGLATMRSLTSFDNVAPRTGNRMLVFESTTPPAPADVVAPYSDVRSAFVEIDEGADYQLSFYAAHVIKEGNANPQTNVRFYNGSGAFVGETGFESFASLGSTWTEVTRSFTAPAGATSAEISLIQALGAGNEWHWVTLIDDVEVLTDNLPGSEVIHPVTRELGFEISWPSIEGQDYQVTSSADLSDFTTVEALFEGDGAVMRHAASAEESVRFFRVEEVDSP